MPRQKTSTKTFGGRSVGAMITRARTAASAMVSATVIGKAGHVTGTIAANRKVTPGIRPRRQQTVQRPRRVKLPRPIKGSRARTIVEIAAVTGTTAQARVTATIARSVLTVPMAVRRVVKTRAAKTGVETIANRLVAAIGVGMTAAATETVAGVMDRLRAC